MLGNKEFATVGYLRIYSQIAGPSFLQSKELYTLVHLAVQPHLPSP